MGHARRYTQLDVFTDTPCLGNPVAVVHAACGLDHATMAAFARWTNLSETTFLLPPTQPGADYRLRIFTPGGELPFAGHPTLGSCRAWLDAGGHPADPDLIVQECGVGLIRIRRSGTRLAFAAPPLRRTGPMDEAELTQVRSALGLQPHAVRAHQWIDNGPGWCALLLDDADRVLGLRPNLTAMGAFKVGVIAPRAGTDGEGDFEVRAFVPSLGVGEDPVTGSLNAGLAQWLMASGVAPERYVARQGTVLGRRGQVRIERIGADVWVGGETAPCITGTVTLG
jgi:PhzF family phenazine biosynthesis protein